MKKKIFYFLMLLVLSNAKAQITPSLTIPNPIPEYNGTYEGFGLHHLFYPNENETRYATDSRPSAIEEVKFYTKHTYPHKYLLADNSISFVFSRHDTVAGSSPVDSLHRIDIEMDRGSTTAFLARVDTQSTGILNYFDEWYGAGGRTDVRGGAAIVVQSIYPNIDMVYTSNNTGLKIYYIVYPGGNPNQIILKVNGSKSNQISGSQLLIDANWSAITFVKPKMYQYTYIGSVITPTNICPASWQGAGTDSYQITTNSFWDTSLPLVIQVSEGPQTSPSINSINWSTYFGGGEEDYIFVNKSDASNNLYASGSTYSNDFPQAPGAIPVQSQNFGIDCFLSKFDPNGILKWSTYLGGSSTEEIRDIDFKGGDVWCVGWTASTNFPVQSKSGAFNDNSFAISECDGFIFQVDASTGGTNKWTTYFGGDRYEDFRGCKFDVNGNFFVCGSGSSTNLGVLISGSTGSYQQNFNSSQQAPVPNPPVRDGIILKFDASNSSLNWFTYYGTDTGNDYDDAVYDIDISGSDLYIAGYASGTNLPGSLNSKSSTFGTEGFLAKFSTNGVLSAARYTSGNLSNRSVRIYNGNVYACGYGKNGMTPVNSGSYYFDGTCASGDYDAVLSAHPLNLSTTTHNTFIGGNGDDNALEMQITPNGVIYIAGYTYASNFPITSVVNAYNMAYAGNKDYFIAAMQQGNSNLVWSTCLGSSDSESGFSDEKVSISYDGQNYLHLTGCSDSYNTFPLNNNGGIPYFQPSGTGPFAYSNDGTITRFDLTPISTFVGIDDFRGTSFSFGLYPNPTKDFIIVNNPELENKTLKYAIYDAEGKKVREVKLISEIENKINVSDLNQGIYYINVSNGDRTFSNKFIKLNK